MDAPLLNIITVAADGSILQTARAGSLQAAAMFPIPSGGAVLGFCDPPAIGQLTHRYDFSSRAFEALEDTAS